MQELLKVAAKSEVVSEIQVFELVEINIILEKLAKYEIWEVLIRRCRII